MENGKNRWRATRPAAFVLAAMASSACHDSKAHDGTSPSASTSTTTAPASTGALGTATEPGRAQRTATLKLQVNDPSAYCRSDDCNGTPPVSIRRLDSTEPLALTPGRCARSCADCREPVCPTRPCSSMGLPMMDTEFVWDGTYYEASTCGAGVPCVTERHASDGPYVAEWCGLRGSRTIDSIGAPQCIEGGGRRCVSVPFDFPARSPRTTSF